VIAANLTGKQIGDFILEDRIGRGGMAVVYRALQASVNRHVAIKIVPLDIDDEFHDEFAARFDLETKLIASLEHIHICRCTLMAFLTTNIRIWRAFDAWRNAADLLRNGPLPLETR
jgi:serine/threonine-protein kinase